MTQDQRLEYLIHYLLAEREEYRDVALPVGPAEKRRLLRALVNVRPPEPLDQTFYQVQDAYLQEELRRKGVTRLSDLEPVRPGLYLWQGDITTLAVDAIVNAANSAMLGWGGHEHHGIIDNFWQRVWQDRRAFYAAAGVRPMMALRPGEEPPGRAEITNAYNLPCRYVLHTVGPIVHGAVTDGDRALLASCYRSCLELAAAHRCRSVAFCCISTGEFHFPHEEAARIAVQTVEDYQARCPDTIEVIFNVFKDIDKQIYQRLLG